ncbi:HNH endonuclease signature motif containing protein [Nostoc favosum]|uniref:HNH endonuclease n=1 Tax=Nostoc favosum CHAB5714 TaxID=2780399 RepID=A0ABS8IK30_9NOSO|nr:HNH endonuclease signature motif containing protein [Nostoc favosum]MCC5604643.1 HNH endonuclease [Nostoc favosum CHAB5714]
MGRKAGQPRRAYDKCLDSGHFNAKPELAAAYWELYQQGFSTTDIAKAHRVSRGAVHTLLKSHGYSLKEKKQLPFIMFNGAKYTLKPIGYYARTDGERELLHRDIWEYHNGQILDGWDIHHINSDKQDNRIENLECFSA